MKLMKILWLALLPLMMISCVTSKKYKASERKYSALDSMYRALRAENSKCREKSLGDDATIESLKTLVNNYKSTAEDYKHNNSQILGQLKDLSVITGTQAESIKKSMDNIGVKDQYIKELQAAMNRKDSLNLALVINLKSAIGNLNDKDINIKVDKGVVYVDISDKLLFNTGRYDVTEKAKEVLGKVAKVLQAQPDIEFLVEGHTDNVPFHEGVLQDNWDLSSKRATAVIRILQYKYHLDPARMTAGGRGEYIPVSSNDTKEGRAENRRTRIVILPQLDQFFKLLEKPANSL